MENLNVIIILILIITTIVCCNNTESFGNSDFNGEAVQNISSVYNENELTVGNIKATGSIVSDNGVTAKNININNDGEAVITLSGKAGDWKILADDENDSIEIHSIGNNKKTLTINNGGNVTSGGSVISKGNLVSQGTLNVSGLSTLSDLTATGTSTINTPVYICNRENGAAINVFTDSLEYPNNNKQLMWIVEFHNAIPTSQNNWFHSNINGKYMSFKNLSNNKYLSVGSVQKGHKLTTRSSNDNNSKWLWQWRYLTPKSNTGLKVNCYRCTHDIGNSNKIILWDNGWKNWECEFEFKPVIFN